MGEIYPARQNELTLALAKRMQEQWDAYIRVDEAAHSAVLAEDFRAVHPNGTLHIGKPSAAEIAAEPIEDYWLRELEAWPVGEEAAIATYTAEVEVHTAKTSGRFRFSVGEVWVREGGAWKCRYYHATMLK
jgi:uncharacterized protein DUF4440